MREDIRDGIKNDVTSAVDSGLFAIEFNLSNVFGGLLYSLKLEMEKEGHVGVIDKLINQVINTSRYDGPDGEEFPVWDEKTAEDYLAVLKKALQLHGIKGTEQ